MAALTVSLNDNVYDDVVLEFFNKINTMLNTIRDIHRLCNSRILKLCKESICRLQFLEETITLLTAHVSTQPNEIKNCVIFQRFIELVTNRLLVLSEILEKIALGTNTITNNFDIFELKLRWYWIEMEKMFPSNEHSSSSLLYSPLNLIEDLSARSAWRKSFGILCFYVTFDDFIEMLESHQFHITRSLRSHLKYFLNFPEDDLITPVKFNFIVNIIGSFDETFTEKFEERLSGDGFLGLINRIQASEILLSLPNRSFLIRTSRTDPQFLAFSYKNSNGEIKHRLNQDKEKKLIPIESFIAQNFPGYTFVDIKLDIEKMEHIKLSDYAESAEGYYK